MKSYQSHIARLASDRAARADEPSRPLIYECRGDQPSLDHFCEWLHQESSRLLAESTEWGAVLFRGFPVRDSHDFDRVVSSFGLENFPYYESLSNAVRINYTPRVFSANEAPPTVKIYLHHEMAQTPIYPERLFFFCQQPAAEGGQTPLCRSDLLWQTIEQTFAEFAERCRCLGLRYTHVMPPEEDFGSGMGRSWASTLRASSTEEAEARLRQLGYQWEWLNDRSLRVTTPRLPAVLQIDGERRSFFNQLLAAYQGWKDSRNDPAGAVRFADGSTIDGSIVGQIAQIAEAITYDHSWQQGDVLLLDNRVVMHGRRIFSGLRKVLASLAEPRKNCWTDS
ncbi:MAG: syringomycin biosynthesis enzyme [Pirellulaceae bacterium]|nr:MAG: syringomycin biosynthesis enzyme [Pirellulaceae bacterium]GIW96500.1 MAG: syringomycin biosynthesis enzyme [Pirellulaceae bacterium]